MQGLQWVSSFEDSLLISSKSGVIAQIFNINVGFSELENPDSKTSEGKKYALYLGDTVLVNEDSPASSLTPLKKKTKQISVFLKTELTSKEKHESGICGPARTIIQYCPSAEECRLHFTGR